MKIDREDQIGELDIDTGEVKLFESEKQQCKIKSDPWNTKTKDELDAVDVQPKQSTPAPFEL